MGLFDFLKKHKNKKVVVTPTSDCINDTTYIREMVHGMSRPWQQYDVLLAAMGYGWEMMINWADYLVDADIKYIDEVTYGSMAGVSATDITKSFHESGDKCANTPELQTEHSILSIAGASLQLHAPVKIIWFNQTRMLRFFTLVDDDMTMLRYTETVIRRSFGSDNAMRLGTPLPDNETAK